MDRLACVRIPALPLQLLLKRHPDWASHPVVVVDQDKPQGLILWVSDQARKQRIRSGMRYAAALSLASTLHAGEVPSAEIEQGVADLVDKLQCFSPGIEPSADEPGLFWLDASGLSQLYRSPRQWGQRILAHLATSSFGGLAVVGWSRFGTYAIAHAGVGFVPQTQTQRCTFHRNVMVLRDPVEERAVAEQVSLACLGLAPKLRELLERLGVRTVRELLELPAASVHRRLGPEASKLHRMATGDLWIPLAPISPEDPVTQHADLDEPEHDVPRMLFMIKRMVSPMLAALTSRHQAMTALHIHLRLEDGKGRDECLRPAEPTLDERLILNLIHLRLDAMELAAGITRMDLHMDGAPVQIEQLALFAKQVPRDLAAADRALARVRAELGDRAVVHARLEDGHLPEAQFNWQPLGHMPHPKPREVCVRPMVRRICTRPVLLPPRPRTEPDGWLLRGTRHGHVTELCGPHLVTGAWWRMPIEREYYFAHMRDGELVWIYYDRRRRRWAMHGEIA